MKTVLGTIGIFSLALSIGRLAGLLRETILSSRLGTSSTADSIVLMLTLPDFLVALVLSGGASAALVPAFRRVDNEKRKSLYTGAVILAALTGTALAAVIATTPLFWLGLLAQSAEFNVQSEFVSVFRLSLIAIPIAAIIAISTAYLTAVGRFSTSAVGTILFNLIIAGFLATMDIPAALKSFAVCLVAAIGFRLLVQLSQMPETFPPKWPAFSVDKALLGRFCQGVIAHGCIVAVPIFYRSMHSSLGEGSLVQFNFALRIFELPNAILLAPIVTIFLTLLADAYEKNNETFQQKVETVFRVAIAGGTGAAAFIAINASGIVNLIFGYGAMTQTMQNSVVELVQILMASLPFAAIFQVGASALNAKNETNIFLRNGVTAFALSIFAHYLLSGQFWSSGAGLFAFFAIGAVLNILSIMRPPEIGKLGLSCLPFLLKLAVVMALTFAAYEYFEPLTLFGFFALCAAQGIALILIAIKEIRLLQSLRMQRL
ncbi:hypothetical protein N9M73_05220 [Rhodobacteraceae bacterium]|nr:hypothetical protein [Paracoccaceae bacterium]